MRKREWSLYTYNDPKTYLNLMRILLLRANMPSGLTKSYSEYDVLIMWSLY